MPQEPQSLRRQFGAVTKWFSEFGARLADVADRLRDPGVPPAEDVIQELANARREFDDLRAGVLELAASLSVMLPKPPDAIATLRDLDSIIRVVGEVIQNEEKRRVLAAAQQEVFAVLDRVARVAHKEDANFGALRACQAKAQELRDTVAGAASLDVDAQLKAWAEGTRPFNELLKMVEGQEAVDDERWSQLEEAVAAAFGRPLAIAATRGKLVGAK